MIFLPVTVYKRKSEEKKVTTSVVNFLKNLMVVILSKELTLFNYSNVCPKLCHSVMQIFTESGEVNWSDKILYETVHRWRKIFLTGTESVQDQ